MTFYFQQILDEGTTNPIVTRIGNQLGALAKLCRIKQEKKDDLNFIFYEMMKAILSADKVASALIDELQSIKGDLKKNGLQLQGHGCAIPSSLKLDSIKVFLKHAHEALKLLAQALSVFFDKGWTEANFDSILNHIEKEQDKLDEAWFLSMLLKNNLNWLIEMGDLRNVDEHKYYKRQKKKALVENYELSNIQGHLTLIRPKLCNGNEVLPFLIDANTRLFIFSEEIIVSAIALFLPEPVSICEIPVEERQKDCPKRFKHCLGFIPFPASCEEFPNSKDQTE